MRYKIGEFARLAGTSLKALRFYDQIGLLKPAHVDARTRYRFYKPEQLRDLAAIRALQDLGASLEDIRGVIRHPQGEERRRLLQDLRDRIAQRIRAANRSLRWIDHAIENEMDGTGAVPVVIKRRDEIRIASIRTQLRNYVDLGEVEFDLAHAVRAEFQNGVKGVLWHRCEASGAIDGEPFIEIASCAPRSCAYEVKQLPKAIVASAYCESDDQAAVRTYDAIDRWLHAHDFRLAGPKRELYVGRILEIQFPVMPA
ncbi:MAG: MerR family transcriptional regulator [Steroidobacteraceae bacterium]